MRFARLSLLLITILAWPQDKGGLSLADFEKSVTEFTLSNGMKFIVVERHQVPVVAFELYVDVGAADETSGMTGVSHLFEHMAFKGTPAIGTANATAEKKAMSAQDTAYLALETERLKGPQADPEKLKKLAAAFEEAGKPLEKLSEGDLFSKILERNGE